MGNIFLLYLVVKLSSISFQFICKSSIPLLDDLKLTGNYPYRFSKTINHYIKTENPIQKIKLRFLGKTLFETYIKDAWLPILTSSDSILPPT